MTKTLKILVVAVAATTALALTAGPAVAHGGKRGPGPHVLVRAAAAYLGVGKQELREARTAGQSLAQLAVAKGKSVDGLKAAMITAGNARIDAAVAKGRLTSDRAAAMKTRLPARVDRIVNWSRGARARR